VGRPLSYGKIERFFQTHQNHRWRFELLAAFLNYYNQDRPHQSFRYDELETPAEAFERLLPTAENAAALAAADGGKHATK